MRLCGGRDGVDGYLSLGLEPDCLHPNPGSTICKLDDIKKMSVTSLSHTVVRSEWVQTGRANPGCSSYITGGSSPATCAEGSLTL